MDWKKTNDKNGRIEWQSGDYEVVEMKRPIDDNEYFCYYKGGFLTSRATPELAKELCEIHNGKE